MQAVEQNADWNLYSVSKPGTVLETVKARDLLHMMAEAAWECGDPGIQYDTTINSWHTVPNSGKINASNPCSEFLFLDNTSCNLASLNLLRFLKNDGTIDIEDFKYAVDITITAQEILVSNSSYPTPVIAENSEKFRPLGLGYANLGALLMARGVPYDSDGGRELAAVLTAIMTGEAYAQSARIASVVGSFQEYSNNREPMLAVMQMHAKALLPLTEKYLEKELLEQAYAVWDDAYALGMQYGYRNAQVTVLAPTGTISFMLDCDTTGVEPDIALVKYKKMVGGGNLKIVNQTVSRALHALGYSGKEVDAILQYVNEKDTIEGAPFLKAKDVSVFDCAFRPLHGERSISWRGHLLMLAAVCPFLSGSASKTVNLPNDVTVDEIEQIYVEGWKLGLKCVAIYRDGCKRSQPLSTAQPSTGTQIHGETKSSETGPVRRRLPADRSAMTHKFEIGGHEGYITVGLYEDGTPGEIFLRVAKEGSTISGLMESFAVAVSMALQYGVPLPALIDKFVHSRFEPQGFTKNPEIPIAKSMMDYIFKWMATKFCSSEEQDQLGIIRRTELTPTDTTFEIPTTVEKSMFTFSNQADAPLCICGMPMVRNGACYKCLSCGNTSGCS